MEIIGKSSIRQKSAFLRISGTLLVVMLAFVVSSCSYRPRSAERGRRDGTMHGPDYNTEQYRSDEYTSNDGRKRSSRDYGCSSNYTEVPLEIENGVYMIHARVNDVPMKFVFDTGASFISMSLTEAQFLYKQGTITDDDIIGSINFEDANGDISESMVVKLHTLQLGNLILRDVRASVVNNQSAPLLLGQSALQEFGSIKIDNKNHKIILENH